MTQQIQARLTELREAAEQMRRSSLQIDLSVQEIRHILNLLLAAGYQSTAAGEFGALYTSYYSTMETWAGDILHFAERLSGAANDVELAMSNQDTTDSPLPAFRFRIPRRGQNDPDPLDKIRAALFPTSEAAPIPRLAGYVSEANRPLFDLLNTQKQQLSASQQQLVDLLQQRQTAQEELSAFRNRLLSFDRSTDFLQVPRVQALENSIAQIDKEISQAQERIGHLQIEVEHLSQRLERVQPAAGADLLRLLEMEHGSTAPWVKTNTFDCVNYIVNKLPIPPNIANNAYLWDDRAAALSQYGISSGDTPLVGSVIVMEQTHSYADPVFGHLMYVERVENGEVWITDNLHPDTPVRLTDLTQELTGPNIKYLYFPWHTQA